MELLVPEFHRDENNRTYACRALRMNIMTLRLKPGEAINEVELCDLLHMSRTPIHEAIAALRDEWLVEIFPQRGTRVSRIDPALVKEGYATRLLLESNLLRDLAGKQGWAQIHELLECMHKMELLRDTMPEAADDFIGLDDELHRMIYVFGGRRHTWHAMRGLVSHYDRLRYLDMLEGICDYELAMRQHREFCDYLLMGMPDGVSAEQKVREHLTSYKGNLLERMERHPDYFSIEGIER